MFPRHHLDLETRLAPGATALSIVLVRVEGAIQRRDLRRQIGAQRLALVSQVTHDLDGRLATDLEALESPFDDVVLETIAEFVEVEETRDVLGTIGIDMARRYLTHRPAPSCSSIAEAG